MTEVGPLGDPQGLGDLGSLDTMSIDAAMMEVQIQRASLLQDQLRGKIDDIQNNNNKITQLNQFVAMLAKLKAGTTGPDCLLDGPTLEAWTATGISLGDPGPAINLKSGEAQVPVSVVDDAIAQAKNEVDSANSTQQLQMVDLQDLTGKYNEAVDAASNFIADIAKLNQDIGANTR